MMLELTGEEVAWLTRVLNEIRGEAEGVVRSGGNHTRDPDFAMMRNAAAADLGMCRVILNKVIG